MGTETQKEKITAKDVYKALLSGNLLILLGVDKLLPYILVLFVLGWVNIFMNYRIEHVFYCAYPAHLYELVGLLGVVYPVVF